MIYSSSQLKPYHFALIWIVFTAILQLIGKQYFRYESDVLSSLELWRLLSAHAVHLNWTHWLLNNLGLILLVAILRVRWTVRFWLKVVVIQSLGISAAFLLFNEHLNWYVGFSGVLYGLYILAGLLSYKKDKLMSLIVLAIVITKIMAEQLVGSEVSTQALLGAPVVIDAHAYGVVLGLVMGVLLITKLIKIN